MTENTHTLINKLTAAMEHVAPLDTTFQWAAAAVWHLRYNMNVKLEKTALGQARRMSSHCSGSGAAEIAWLVGHKTSSQVA